MKSLNILMKLHWKCVCKGLVDNTINIGSGYGLVPLDTKPSPGLMFNICVRCDIAFIGLSKRHNKPYITYWLNQYQSIYMMSIHRDN